MFVLQMVARAPEKKRSSGTSPKVAIQRLKEQLAEAEASQKAAVDRALEAEANAQKLSEALERERRQQRAVVDEAVRLALAATL